MIENLLKLQKEIVLIIEIMTPTFPNFLKFMGITRDFSEIQKLTKAYLMYCPFITYLTIYLSFVHYGMKQLELVHCQRLLLMYRYYIQLTDTSMPNEVQSHRMLFLWVRRAFKYSNYEELSELLEALLEEEKVDMGNFNEFNQ